MPPKKRPSGKAVAKAKEKAKNKATARAGITKARISQGDSTKASRAAGHEMATGTVGLNEKLDIKMDVDAFARHPAPASLGGKREHISKFPGGGSKSGYAYLLQRLSDYVHTVAAYCKDPSRDAHFSFVRVDKQKQPQRVWVPPANCGLGGSAAPAGASVVNAVHLDLVNAADGRTRLTKEALLASVTSATTHIFLNSFKDPATTCAAIGQSGRLQVCVFLECHVSSSMIEALAAKGGSLRGLVFNGCTCDGLSTTDDCWAHLFAAARTLLWFQADFRNSLLAVYPIGPQTWQHLPPSLHVFTYIGNLTSLTGQRSGVEHFKLGHQPTADEDAVNEAVARLPALKWSKTGN
jgi:hypothetical protein